MTSAHWVRLTECATGLEADMLRQTLEASNIPVQLRSNQAGIFGAAYQGNVTGGIEVMVPSPVIGRAKAILNENTATDIIPDEYDDEVL